MNDLVKEWMTSDPISIRGGTLLADARQRMERDDIRRLLVVDGSGLLIGIVTWGDIAEAWPSPFTDYDPSEIRELMSRVAVDEVMAVDLICADLTTTVTEAANMMFEHRIGALPIVDQDRAVGILTNSDILQGLVRVLAGSGS